MALVDFCFFGEKGRVPFLAIKGDKTAKDVKCGSSRACVKRAYNNEGGVGAHSDEINWLWDRNCEK